MATSKEHFKRNTAKFKGNVAGIFVVVEDGIAVVAVVEAELGCYG